MLSPWFSIWLTLLPTRFVKWDLLWKWGLNENHFSSLVLMRTKSEPSLATIQHFRFTFLALQQFSYQHKPSYFIFNSFACWKIKPPFPKFIGQGEREHIYVTEDLANPITNRAQKCLRRCWRQSSCSHWRCWAGRRGQPSGLPPTWHPCKIKLVHGFFGV